MSLNRYPRRFIPAIALTTLIGILSSMSFAQTSDESDAAPSQTPERTVDEASTENDRRIVGDGAPLTVAVLSFDASDVTSPDLGSQLSEMVTVALSTSDNFSLIDRTLMSETLDEHELNLTGLVAAGDAIEVGRLTGARILVTGRAFKLGNSKFVTAKLIGTETSRIEAVMVKADADSDLAEMVMQLSEKVDRRISQSGPELVGDDMIPVDPLPALLTSWNSRDVRPTVAVFVSERHLTGQQPSEGINSDPAVETEIKRILLQAGFRIKDIAINELADWDGEGRWPHSLDGVDIVVTGEAFSEFGGRIGDLINCVSRAELNLISRSDGMILQAHRVTSRSVDLAENIASKSALQKTGRQLAISILSELSQPANESQDP